MNPCDDALDLLEEYPDKIPSNSYISDNPNIRALKLLEKNPEKIDWYRLSQNKNPKALKLLQQNVESIHWNPFFKNSAFFEIDFCQMAKDRSDIFREDLMKVVFHPNRLKKLGYFEINES